LYSQERTLKNAFAIVTLTAVLSACAAPQVQDKNVPASVPAPAQAQPQSGLDAVPDAARPEAAGQQNSPAADLGTDAPAAALPNVPLNSDLLYKLTKAELEFKQGNWEGPYTQLMVLAQQTRDPRLAQRATEMALTAKQGEAALAAIRLWRELAPNSEEATQYFLGFVVMTDEPEQAEPIFAERIKNARPEARGVAMLQMQQFLSRAKDKLVAFAILERVLAPYGDTQEAHLVLAQGAYGLLGEPARAVREAKRALEIKPDSELAVLTLAQVTAEPSEVTATLAAFLDKYPAASEVRTAYARVLVEQQQYAKAREQFQVLLKAQPDNVATLYALGIVSMQMKENGAAEGYLKQFLAAMDKQPAEQRDSVKALALLSEMAEERKDFKGAIAWIDKIPTTDAHAYFIGRIRRAQLIAKSGDLKGGRKALAELKPDDRTEQTQVVLADAQILRDSGDVQQSLSVLEAGVRRYPDNVELLYDFALAAEKMGKVDIMEDALRKVITLEPNNHQAYNALGYSLAERNIRLPEAYALIEQALKMAPTDPFIMDSMGWIQFRLGHLPQAEEILRRAYALRSDPEIAVHLGEVLWQAGNKEDAQKIWREARSKDPKNDTLKSTLARLNASL
jgi:tetratricopeptide (TPR) repeat protein